jgi:hypothetical protein
MNDETRGTEISRLNWQPLPHQSDGWRQAVAIVQQRVTAKSPAEGSAGLIEERWEQRERREWTPALALVSYPAQKGIRS